MENLNVPGPVVVVGVAFLLALLLVRRAAARRAREQADAMYRSARLVSLAGRVVVNAAVIVAAQWTVLALARDWWMVLAALGVPALFAAYPVTRAMVISTVDDLASRSRRGRR